MARGFFFEVFRYPALPFSVADRMYAPSKPGIAIPGANGKPRRSDVAGDGIATSGLPVLSPPDAQVGGRLNGNGAVALVHDWLPVYGGAERVLEQMISVFPESSIYSLFDFLPADQRGFLQGKTVHTSFLQRLPFARSKYRCYLPLTPLAIEQFDLSGYDVVISSNYVVAKGVITAPDQLHISYVHSPIRYAWDLQHTYLRQQSVERGVRSLIVRLVLHYMRLFDATSASRVDAFVANSRHVSRRIWKAYRRPSKVIYPPVDTDAFQPYGDKEDYYVTVSRLVSYKRVDLIVEAFNRMPDKELIIIGDGPELVRIREAAGPNISVMGYQPFDVVRHYMQRARAFLFAAEEDFGIVAVEAQACGTPVIAYGRGGATETVIHGETGLHFSQQTPECLVAAVEAFENGRSIFRLDRIRAHAERFSIQRFRTEFDRYVNDQYHQFRRNL